MLTKLDRKIFALLWLLRLPIVSVSILLAMISLNYAGVYELHIVIPLALVIIAGYIQNDIFDIQIDVISAPQRPLPSGMFSVCEAKILYKIMIALGFLYAITLQNILYFIYLSAILIVFYIYSKHCKANWILKNLFTALCSVTVVLIPLFYEGKINMQIVELGVMAFLFTFGREIFMDIRDRDGDKVIPNIKRPSVNFGLFISFILLLAAFLMKEIFFLEISFIRYLIYVFIILMMLLCFANKKSVYWIVSESIKIIFIYDLITIYLHSR